MHSLVAVTSAQSSLGRARSGASHGRNKQVARRCLTGKYAAANKTTGCGIFGSYALAGTNSSRNSRVHSRNIVRWTNTVCTPAKCTTPATVDITPKINESAVAQRRSRMGWSPRKIRETKKSNLAREARRLVVFYDRGSTFPLFYFGLTGLLNRKSPERQSCFEK